MEKLSFCSSVGTLYLQISCTNMQDRTPIKDNSGAFIVSQTAGRTS
jgi:hypothetical protein